MIWGITKKIDYLSADPIGERYCPPLYPGDSVSSKNTLILSQAQIPRILPFIQNGGTINDASCLNKTSVYGIAKPQSEEDLKNVILYAKEKELKISIAGVKHSMGGQAFAKDALVIDMTGLKQMSLDKDNKVLHVQSGATWHDIQNMLHAENLAVKAMQSVDVFTIGGTISVNAHGMDNRTGSIASTIRSLRIMDTNGNVKTLSRTENDELFRAVIGGYGLFGIILDAELDVIDNAMYKEEREVIQYQEYPQLYNKLMASETTGMIYGHLSIAPHNFFKDMIVFKFITADSPDSFPPLQERSQVKLRRFVINVAKTGPVGKEIKWFGQRYLEPLFQHCYKSRNQAISEPEACLISRNQQMHDPDKYLLNNLQNDTDILQEYFFPRTAFVPFIDGVREILQRNNTNVINASIRAVNKEDIMLNYAPEDMFALVLYINQKVTPTENEKMKKVTQDLIDFTIQMDGKFYLPYQLYYSRDQLKTSYPNIDAFFALKKQVDPDELIINKFYLKYREQL